MKNQITKADFRLQNEVTMFEKMTFQNQEEKDDLDSIFNTSSNALFGQGISGLDDFELITFVVIK